MTMYVTRVVLSHLAEPTRHDTTSTPGREPFTVSWTLSELGCTDQDFEQSHSTLSAAQMHAIKLLRRIRAGASVSDVYAEKLDVELPSQLSSSAELCVCGHPSHPGRFCSCGCSISETDNGRDATSHVVAPIPYSRSG